MRALIGILFCATLSVPGHVIAADTFPDRYIRFIVPFPPSGGTGPLARAIGAKLTEAWGQQVIIDHRPGVRGSLGTAVAAKAAPDGYTILLAESGAMVINPHLYASTGYDTLRDFAPVSRGTTDGSVLVVHPALPVKTMKDLAALAKKNPDKLAFASGGSAAQLAGELFKLTTGTKITYIPYNGAAPAIVDLMAGNVSIMFGNPAGTVPHIRSGRLRALAVTGHTRLEALTNVPHAVEAGFPELDIVNWYGIVAPAATPRNVIARLNAGIVGALNSPDLRAIMLAAGTALAPSTPDEFAEQIRNDYDRWGKIVKAVGIKID